MILTFKLDFVFVVDLDMSFELDGLQSSWYNGYLSIGIVSQLYGLFEVGSVLTFLVAPGPQPELLLQKVSHRLNLPWWVFGGRHYHAWHVVVRLVHLSMLIDPVLLVLILRVNLTALQWALPALLWTVFVDVGPAILALMCMASNKIYRGVVCCTLGLCCGKDVISWLIHRKQSCICCLNSCCLINGSVCIELSGV